MTKSASTPFYTAPPIIEAVVQFLFLEPLSNALYRKLTKRLKRSYANHVASETVNAKIDFQNRSVQFDGQPQIRLSSTDEADVLIVHRNSLTWSRLAPYQGWEPFIERIRADAKAAHAVAGHRKLGRMGVRYVNRLDVPPTDNVVHYEDYLAINIDLPETLPVVENYAWRFEREFPEQKLRAIVQSAVVNAEVPDTGAFVLDIDIVARQDLPTKLDDIFTRLEEMRMLKNEIFEISIRDKARASFSS